MFSQQFGGVELHATQSVLFNRPGGEGLRWLARQSSNEIYRAVVCRERSLLKMVQKRTRNIENTEILLYISLRNVLFTTGLYFRLCFFSEVRFDECCPLLDLVLIDKHRCGYFMCNCLSLNKDKLTGSGS